jgi:hypothetical protein
MSALLQGGAIQPCNGTAFVDCGLALSDTDTVQSGVTLRIAVVGVCPGIFAFPGDQDVQDQLWLQAGDLITVTGYVLSDPETSLIGALQNFIPSSTAIVASIQTYIYATANAVCTVGQLKAEIQNAYQAVNNAKAVSCSWTIGEVAQIQQMGQSVSQAVATVANDVAGALPSTSSVGLVLIGVGILAIGLLIWINKLEATA